MAASSRRPSEWRLVLHSKQQCAQWAQSSLSSETKKKRVEQKRPQKRKNKSTVNAERKGKHVGKEREREREREREQDKESESSGKQSAQQTKPRVVESGSMPCFGTRRVVGLKPTRLRVVSERTRWSVCPKRDNAPIEARRNAD
jgi:hypothetical protein